MMPRQSSPESTLCNRIVWILLICTKYNYKPCPYPIRIPYSVLRTIAQTRRCRLAAAKPLPRRAGRLGKSLLPWQVALCIRLIYKVGWENSRPYFIRYYVIHSLRNLITKVGESQIKGVYVQFICSLLLYTLVVHIISFYFITSMSLQPRRLMMSPSSFEGRRRSHNSSPHNLSCIRKRKQLPASTMAISFLLKQRDQLQGFVILFTFERCTPCARLILSPTLYDPRISLSCIYSQHFTPGLFPVP